VRAVATSVIGLTLLAASAPALADIDRAWRNYQAVLSGTRTLAELTPEELREVAALDAQARGQVLDQRSPRQRCIDSELARLEREPSELALRTIDLKCSQRQDR